MNKRPAAFTMMSVLLTTILLSSVAYVLTSDFSIRNTTDMYLVALLISATALLTIAAFGVWRPRPWGYLALICAISLIAALDLVALLATRKITLFYFPDLVLIGSGLMILSDSKARDLFFHASKRWWETAKRIALRHPSVERSSDATSSSDVEIVNISETGCLVKSTKDHTVGDNLELRITPDLWLKAVLVRQIEGPKNTFGAKFEFKNWSERRQLKKFVDLANTVVSNESEPIERKVA